MGCDSGSVSTLFKDTVCRTYLCRNIPQDGYGEETTGVKVYSGLLELTKPSVTDVTLWASETVDLPLGGGYISCFILMTAMLRHFRPAH